MVKKLRAFQRMKELQASENGNKMLRLSVEAGGCSGFQYAFALDELSNISNGDDMSVIENPSAVGGCSCKSSFMVKL
ncbi:iron-sulfur assembly protein IscA-like 2, mitochondrial [Spinacia oleracea]|uniref:Iron-sulfur assembly protein IscA-like 2, mitochondrial n=1 Tax=Spinacia oleracea TaxID=3562 RepID=A0ABM3RT13_SPIOL|nr:iron-sulfur assembly protein IscA-like 2, mitochondrial [Spinacia oleracea]